MQCEAFFNFHRAHSNARRFCLCNVHLVEAAGRGKNHGGNSENTSACRIVLKMKLHHHKKTLYFSAASRPAVVRGAPFVRFWNPKPIQLFKPRECVQSFFYTIFPNTTGWLMDDCSRNIRPFCVYETKLSTNTTKSVTDTARRARRTIAHA